MPELVDINWFSLHTDSKKTLEQIREIRRWQERALNENYMPNDPSVIELELDGNLIHLEAGSAVNALEIYQEIFRDEDHSIIDGFSYEKAETVIDLGANYGFYSLGVKRINPQCRIVALEPNPYIYPYLKKNLSSFEKIIVLNKAISSKDGSELFDLIRQVPSIGGRTIKQTPREWVSKELIESIEVNTVSLESLLNEYELDLVDILKVDIEGAEGELFDNTSPKILSKAKRIVVERHTRELHDQVIERLLESGFRLVYDQDPTCKKHYGNLYFELAGYR